MKKTFQELLNGYIELTVVQGVTLPNLRMTGEQEKCSFLNEEGRCSIHALRPGICRLFPLGRFYENNSFQYFLQTHECKMEKRTKVKVKKWIDTPELKKNEKFICDWHYFIKEFQEKSISSGDEQYMKKVSMGILNEFYVRPYEPDRDFYEQFYERLETLKKSDF